MKPFGRGMKTPNSERPKGARNKHFQAALEKRRAEAKERQAVRDAMTPQQQLTRLDQLFGAGQGARKERTKLAAQIANPKVVNAVVGLVDGGVILRPLDTTKLPSGKRERRAAKEKAAAEK